MSSPAATNIYTPRQRYLLLIATLVVLGVLALYGLLEYLTAFLGAGILYVVLRPWFTALVHRRRLEPAGSSRCGLLLFAFVVHHSCPFFALTGAHARQPHPRATPRIPSQIHDGASKTIRAENWGYQFTHQKTTCASLVQQAVSCPREPPAFRRWPAALLQRSRSLSA